MNKEVIEIIRKLEDDFGLRLEDIAIKTGLSYASIHGYKLGARNPIQPTIDKLNQILRRYELRDK